MSVAVFLLVFVPLAILITAGCETILREEGSPAWVAYLAGPILAIFPALTVSSPSYALAMVEIDPLGSFVVGLFFLAPVYVVLIFGGMVRLGLFRLRSPIRRSRPTIQGSRLYRFRKDSGQFETVSDESGEG